MSPANSSERQEFVRHLRSIVQAVDQVYGAHRYLLIGAYARDVHILLEAGLVPPRATADVDICIAVPDESALRTALGRLPANGTLRTRRRLSLPGSTDLPIDVLPMGMPDDDGHVVLDEIHYDVRGLEESFRHAHVLELSPGRTVLHPSAAAMIGLKLIAWAVRRKTSDARDIASLIDLYTDEPLVDLVWTDPAAQEYDFVPDLAGPFLAGRELAGTWGADARKRLLEITDPQGDLLDLLLVSLPSRPVAVGRDEQITALRHGLLRPAGAGAVQ